MKIRTGFVSNSSSSSFLIYGITLSGSEMRRMFAAKEANKAAAAASDEDEELEDEEEEDSYEVSEKLEEAGLDTHCPYDDYYIGLSWSDVGDKETGEQFKDRVRQLLVDNLGPNIPEPSTHSEAWYN